MEQLLYKLLSDFGITGAMYVLIMLAFLRYIPKYLERQNETMEKITQTHKEEIERLREGFEKTTERIVGTFTDYVNRSTDWHKLHQQTLNEVKNDVKDVKTFLIKKITNEKE